jgi:probable phosphoglycerate mutase
MPAEAKPTELILIRHGESVANVTPIVAGMQGDVGLTDRGHRQAAALADRMREEKFSADVLYASTLPRAQQTVGYVAPVLGLSVQDEDDLQELRVGVADGLSNAEWAARWPGLTEGFWSRPYQEFAPGGESWCALQLRVGRTLTGLVERHRGERVVAVTHGGVIEASFAMAFGMGAGARSVGFDLTNTGITTWRYSPDSPRGRWTLLAANDTAHLARLEP